MKIAIFADIHSNLEALQACLAHAGREGADMQVFLGDLVGYGADPIACLALMAQYADLLCRPCAYPDALLVREAGNGACRHHGPGLRADPGAAIPLTGSRHWLARSLKPNPPA